MLKQSSLAKKANSLTWQLQPGPGNEPVSQLGVMTAAWVTGLTKMVVGCHSTAQGGRLFQDVGEHT